MIGQFTLQLVKKSDGVDKDGSYIPSKAKGVKVELNPGDMLSLQRQYTRTLERSF
jgi:hypothetical protein